ncbi:MAF1 [Candida margitis]|uniref:MAF1 n=1 Tax=Candida margitis TaxID=1775924 RepID=UPI002225FB91|nr:MAF1 [Candida margitis]KAI5970610.1 MAF1 [Candida margitis]
MKYIDEIDLELVNQELNFTSSDNALEIRGGCELFTTKPIASDRKLFKTIDKHLDQIIEDNILSRSLERDRQSSITSLFGTSGSPQDVRIQEQQQQQQQEQHRQRRSSSNSGRIQFHKSPVPDTKNAVQTDGTSSLLSKSLNAADDSFTAEADQEEHAIDDSPFGPLKNTTTRRTFAYLIGILNHTFPDQDFSNLQPAHDFIKVPTSDLLTKFDNLLLSLGKKSDVLHWMWDILDSYMEVLPSKNSSPYLAAQDPDGNDHHETSTSRKNSMNLSRHGSPPNTKGPMETCSIYSFEPADESIFEDISYPYQPMWSYFWFIYNKKRKRVAFIRLIAINKADIEEDESDDANDEDVVGNIELT